MNPGCRITKGHSRSQKSCAATGLCHDILIYMNYTDSYQCEWQDKIQSVLWSRCSVTLFTIAAYKGEVSIAYTRI